VLLRWRALLLRLQVVRLLRLVVPLPHGLPLPHELLVLLLHGLLLLLALQVLQLLLLLLLLALKFFNI
jgi:hypothetical protein